MFRLFRIQLPLLCVVCLCWTMLFHGSSATASCGNYLHTRQGPPMLRTGSEGPGPFGLTLRAADQHLTTHSHSAPSQPCTGPNCGRSKSPPQPLPAAIPSGSVERDDQCCLCRTTPEPDPPLLFVAPDRFSAWPSADPQPPDMPPDCSGWCAFFRAWRVLV